jgi:hypothetical protein
MSKERSDTTELLQKYRADTPSIAMAPREARKHLEEKDYNSSFEKKALERIANQGYQGQNKNGCTIL